MPNFSFLVLLIIIFNLFDRSKCSSNNYDSFDSQEVEEGRVRIIYVGLIIGAAFFTLFSVILCCFLCPYSFCVLSKWRRRAAPESEVERSSASSSSLNSSIAQFSQVVPRTVTVSSVLMLCDDHRNIDNVMGGFRNPSISDPPPPYPGYSIPQRNAKTCFVNDECPPPYGPSLLYKTGRF